MVTLIFYQNHAKCERILTVIVRWGPINYINGLHITSWNQIRQYPLLEPVMTGLGNGCCHICLSESDVWQAGQARLRENTFMHPLVSSSSTVSFRCWETPSIIVLIWTGCEPRLQWSQISFDKFCHTPFGLIVRTRTTRTPAFWGYPPPPNDYPYYWPVHFESQVHTIDQFISDPKSKQGESRKIRKISEKLKF